MEGDFAVAVISCVLCLVARKVTIFEKRIVPV